MSVEEAPQQPTPPLFLTLDVKPKPVIAPKPPAQASSPSPEDTDGSKVSSGKVKSIVHKFSKQESTAEEHHANDAADASQSKRLKSPPPVKPKPARVSQQLHPEAQQAPPLPAKKRGTLQKQKECVHGEEADSISVAGGRSAPDGKEVEVLPIGGGEADVEHSAGSPQSPCCDPGCSCVCHLHRPGMKLIWVPVDVEDGKREDETSEEAQKGEDMEEGDEVGKGGEAGDEVDGKSASEESDLVEHDKAKFHQSLDILISEGQRRRSDPGPHAVFNSIGLARSQSPPVPPKRTQSPPVNQRPNIDDEENIYELVLQVINPTLKKEVEPPVKVRMPARRSKLIPTPSEQTSGSQTNNDPASGLTDAPPAIPPRMPVAQDSHSHNSVHRGGIALPQPTLEEWRTFLPSSHSGSTAPVPTGSPRVPHRPPPPPPSSSRGRSASAQYLTLKKDGEENGESEGEKDAVDEMTLRRGSFLNWESRLQDEPLYQTYRATVIHKEIKRQTVCRNISKTSVDFSVDVSSLRLGNGTGIGRSSPLPSPAQSTLWQDLAAVRDSGVLETLTSDQCKYQESMFEVLTSETSYLRSLQVLTKHFMDNRELEETLIIRDKKTLFSNILKIREVSERFLKDLEERIFQDVVFSDICDIIFYHAQHKFHAFIDYVRNQIYQEQTFSRLMKTNAQFAAVISRLQESPQCQRLPFMSFLLLPFQRITRIKMLIENILKRTHDKQRAEADEMPSKALAAVSKIIDECNTEVGKMRQMEELIQVSHTLEFDKLKAIPIISQTRFLEKKGEMQEMSKGGTLFNMKAKFNPIHLFLFNDLLVLAVKKSAERFVVVDHAHRSLVQAQPLEVSGSNVGACDLLFNLTLLENHQGRMMERLLKAPSQSDMHRWMAVFPNPTNPDTQENEVIYEDWDCPQVQCLEQYVAQQADELNLEPSDIINVIRKTNEGWYEGSRLSDGQKGWFPAANVTEITNEHVRRRNLRERYRVIQAASLVTNSKLGGAQ